MEIAHSDERVLLTEDKDFGWLVFVAHVPAKADLNAKARLSVSVAPDPDAEEPLPYTTHCVFCAVPSAPSATGVDPVAASLISDTKDPRTHWGPRR